jgi:hypothetical protein
MNSVRLKTSPFSNAGHRPRNTIMKPMTRLFLVGLLAVTAVGDSAWACNPRCQPNRGYIQSAPPLDVRPQPIQQPQPFQPPPNFTPSPNGLTANDTVINDLPADAKRAIRAAAAKVQTNSTFRQPTRSGR